MVGRILLAAAAATALLASTAAGRAGEGETLLTVVDRRGGSETAFDRDTLEAMRQVSYRTGTIWTDGVHEFRGVPLSEVLKAAGVAQGRLVLHATNDYSADIPIEGVEDDVPMIALLLDGAEMSLRDKGPLWIVYPYDRSTDYQSEVIYTRSVWQLVRIEVLP